MKLNLKFLHMNGNFNKDLHNEERELKVFKILPCILKRHVKNSLLNFKPKTAFLIAKTYIVLLFIDQPKVGCKSIAY